MHIKSFHQFQTNVEEKFNIAGGFPIIGIFSGPLRVVAGLVQTVAGSVFAGVGFLGHEMSKHTSSPETQAKWKQVKFEGAEQTLHGALNILNGIGEFLEHTVCAIGLYGLSAPSTLKIRAKRNFQPAFKYGNFGEGY